MAGSCDDVELSEARERFLPDSTHVRKDDPSVPSNRSSITRTVCAFGLAIAVATGAALLPYAIYTISLYKHIRASSSTLTLSPVLGQTVPLMLNLGITALTEALGLIHATGLRWNLMREGRLEFNANLRLFTASHRHSPNSWYYNLLNSIFLILCYTSSSLVLVAQPPPSQPIQFAGNGQGDNQRDFEISGMALFTLAVGLLGQAFFAGWILRAIEMPSWSSSPIDTALIQCRYGARRHQAQTMRSVGDVPSLIPSYPLPAQKAVFRAHNQVRRVLWILWALVLFGVVWTVAVSAGAYNNHVAGCETCGIFTGPGWWPIPGVGGPSPFVALDLPGSGDAAGPVVLIIAFALQASITLGLHCAELLVNVSRDEDVWRWTYQAGGYDSQRYESVFVAVTSWKTILLFLLKPAIHWLYGLGNACVGGILFMRPGQLMWMTFLLVILAVYGTSITRYRRTGPQPVTYGHLQTIINLVDTWHGRMHWGHKIVDQDGICHAGTSDKALPTIWMDQRYL